MAKKNAREEPAKPQVTENEQMSDIVFILDKMELILEAVSQIGKDGKFNTVAADKKNRNSFLKIDRYADAFENFIKNFQRQRLFCSKVFWCFFANRHFIHSYRQKLIR